MVVYTYVVKEVFDIALKEKFFFKCEVIDFREHPDAEKLVHSLWLFHISKLVECLDTVFFILSGKLRLVTWLHVYHHSTMIPYTWVLAKWIPGGQAFNLVLTNGSVHVVMYTYYALAALGPAWRKYLWWKRYLTILQMIQFVYGIASCIGSVYLDCAYNPSVYYFSIVYIFTILGCFYNHYHQTYRAGREHEKRNQPCLDSSLDKMMPCKGKTD
ncbi:Elongation of very long chain fatty acids protein 4 [Fasciola gigantica]|uniref:Elongation of very long chain fatty acids protein n=1 Tax=Fasciola gigantica TaxID=46835 RepID=A0A504YYZ3_FASGI|nr:Elongation of very long chain fatty acids protein 4 [Fasciola gigantica]